MPSGVYERKPRKPLPFKLKKDLTGIKFDRLTAQWPEGRDPGRNVIWLCSCSCECGGLSHVRTFALTDGSTTSCGCRQKEVARASCIRVRTTHGMRRSKEYARYCLAKKRCENPNDVSYPVYGALGTEFRFKSFEEFYAEIGPWPGVPYEVDRIDPFGHYEKGNVRWLTKQDQAHNKKNSLHLPYPEIASRRNAGERPTDLAREFKTSVAMICYIVKQARERSKKCLQ